MEKVYKIMHNKPRKELNYYCSYFIGYTPDCDMSDKEEAELINELRNK